ncbi:MAG: hypothetical protein HWN67_02495 [Candidatus Helarchaeota archaeon]|nr:hypothetical protein [Candidatus Helarchaeota archaeon]
MDFNKKYKKISIKSEKAAIKELYDQYGFFNFQIHNNGFIEKLVLMDKNITLESPTLVTNKVAEVLPKTPFEVDYV